MPRCPYRWTLGGRRRTRRLPGPPACFLPPASPSARLSGQQPVGPWDPDRELRPHKGGTGAWCPLGTSWSRSRSRVTCPGSASRPGASSCAITSYSWTVSWAHCFDWQRGFWFPRAAQPRNAASGASGCGHWRDKGTGQPPTAGDRRSGGRGRGGEEAGQPGGRQTAWVKSWLPGPLCLPKNGANCPSSEPPLSWGKTTSLKCSELVYKLTSQSPRVFDAKEH